MRATVLAFRSTRNVLIAGVLALLLAMVPIAFDRAAADAPLSDTDTVELSSFPTTGTAEVHQLDPAEIPADHTLTKITITASVEGALDGTVQNLSGTSSPLSSSVSAGITVNGPEVTDLTAEDSDAFATTLAGGASTPVSLVASDSVVVEITDPDPLVFIGDGVLEYDVLGQVETTVGGPASYMTTGAASGEATVTIDYQLTPPDPAPAISIVKTNDADGDATFTDSETAPAEDASVPFELEITNTGNVDLTLTELVDEFGGATVDLFDGDHGDCDDLEGTVLAPTDSVTCTFTLDNYAPAPGTSLENTVTVTGEDPEGTEVDDDDPSTVNVLANPAISIVKTNDADGDASFTDSETAPAEGAAVPFHLEITNTGDVTLTLTALVDEFGGGSIDLFGGDFGTCDDLQGTTLVPGASTTCTFTLADYAPAAGSSLDNTVTVTGEDDFGTEVTDDDPSTVDTPEPVCVFDDTTLIKFEGAALAEGNDDPTEGPSGIVTIDNFVLNEEGEIMSLDWTSTVPIHSTNLKAGNDADVITPVNGATSGTIAVPGQNAISHVGFYFCPPDTP